MGVPHSYTRGTRKLPALQGIIGRNLEYDLIVMKGDDFPTREIIMDVLPMVRLSKAIMSPRTDRD